jgi:hypothetical protein
MFDSLKNHFANYTISGLLGRIPVVLASVKTPLTFGGLVVIFIGVALWSSSGSSSAFAIYAITVLALFGAFVIWTDSKMRLENLRTEPPVPPQNQLDKNELPTWTADKLREELERLTKKELRVMKAIAQSSPNGILIEDLRSQQTLTRGETFQTAKTLELLDLIIRKQETDYKYYLSNSVIRVMRRSPTIKSMLMQTEPPGIKNNA